LEVALVIDVERKHAQFQLTSVSIDFLRDVHDKIEYWLALYPPTTGAYFPEHGEKGFIFTNLILSGIH
jgi:hypothetical protein